MSRSRPRAEPTPRVITVRGSAGRMVGVDADAVGRGDAERPHRQMPTVVAAPAESPPVPLAGEGDDINPAAMADVALAARRARARAARSQAGAERAVRKTAQGARRCRYRFTPRHGRVDHRGTGVGERTACAHRAARDAERPGARQRQAVAAPTRRGPTAACPAVSQAGRRNRHAGRSWRAADGLREVAQGLWRTLGRCRPAGPEYRGPDPVHYVGRTGQPADAPALRGRARVRRTRARRS